MTDQQRKRATDERVGPGQGVTPGDTGDGQRTEEEHTPEEKAELKARQAKGNLGPEKQKGFGQGG